MLPGRREREYNGERSTEEARTRWEKPTSKLGKNLCNQRVFLFLNEARNAQSPSNLV
jgi:hypothetical protein